MPVQTAGFQACRSVAHRAPELVARLVVLMFSVGLMAWCSDRYKGVAGVFHPFRPVWKLSDTREIPLPCMMFVDRNAGQTYRLHFPHALSASTLTNWPKERRTLSSGITQT